MTNRERDTQSEPCDTHTHTIKLIAVMTTCVCVSLDVCWLLTYSPSTPHVSK